MPVTPYNTGKVKIGCHYVPPQRNYMTPESEQWQNVFIGGKRSVPVWVWFYVALGVGLLIGFYGFR